MASLRILGLLLPLLMCGGTLIAGVSAFSDDPAPRARVLIVHDPAATEAFEPRADRVRQMVDRAITNWTRQPSLARSWLSLVSTQDTVGIKVHAAPGAHSGTRPAVVAAVVEGLLEAKLPPRRIVIWDKHRKALREAGFFELAARYGVRVEGSAEFGYDEQTAYETPLLGQLVWGDLEFGRKGEGVGRKSHVSKLLTHELTRIINVTPLLNHNRAGVAGNLLGLATASVDNMLRFEAPGRLATAVPEIYALPALGDRVVLHIVDGLICQYQGEQQTLLHYATPLNELRVSNDPVALDVLSLQELDRQRRLAGMPSSLTNHLELFLNAALLELGVAEPERIQVEKLR